MAGSLPRWDLVQRCRCRCEEGPPRPWLLRDDLRPADFDEAIAAGLIDVNALVVPLVSAELEEVRPC